MLSNLTASMEAITPLQVVAAAQAAKAVGAKVAQSNANRANSLVEATRDTRVEPIALIDSTIVNEPITSEILATCTKLFAGYYLRAVDLTSTIGGVEVSKRLSRFNPNRSVIDAVVSTASYASDELYPSLDVSYKVGNEAAKEIVAGEKANNVNDVAASIKQMDNMALGMSINVTFSHEDKTYKMPVNIRMIPVSASPKLIRNTFKAGSNRNSAKERWHRWKAGELSLVSDLILCNDLIKEHRQTQMADKSGFYTETMRRRRNGSIAGMISGEPSIGTSSNVMVISNRTAKEIEYELEGELSVFKIRERAFELTSVMILVVVDPDWERVTMYTRSIEIPTELKFRDFKDVNSKSGPDVSEILRMYQDAAKPNSRTGVIL